MLYDIWIIRYNVVLLYKTSWIRLLDPILSPGVRNYFLKWTTMSLLVAILRSWAAEVENIRIGIAGPQHGLLRYDVHSGQRRKLRVSALTRKLLYCLYSQLQSLQTHQNVLYFIVHKLLRFLKKLHDWNTMNSALIIYPLLSYSHLQLLTPKRQVLHTVKWSNTGGGSYCKWSKTESVEVLAVCFVYLHLNAVGWSMNLQLVTVYK